MVGVFHDVSCVFLEHWKCTTKHWQSSLERNPNQPLSDVQPFFDPHFQASVKSQRPAAAKLLRNSKKRCGKIIHGRSNEIPGTYIFWFFKKNVLNFSSFCSSRILPVLKDSVFVLHIWYFPSWCSNKQEAPPKSTVGNWKSPWGFFRDRITHTYDRRFHQGCNWSFCPENWREGIL